MLFYTVCTRLNLIWMFLTYFCEIIIWFWDWLCLVFTMMENHKSVDNYSFKLFSCESVTSKKDSNVPLPRSGHRIVCDANNLYSFGGYNPQLTGTQEQPSYHEELNMYSFPLFQELWRYNFATKSWKRYCSRETLPLELASNAVIRQGNFLMVYGGTGSPFGYRCSNQLYMCLLNEGKGHMFEVTASGTRPLPQYGQALVYHNGYLYTIGGTTGFEYTCDIHRLNISKKIWESVYICRGQTDLEPEGRYRHEVAFNGKNIFLLGGGTADKSFDFQEIAVFNIEIREWTRIKTKSDPLRTNSLCHNSGYPKARRCHGAVQIETGNDIHVFIAGGYDGRVVFDDLWRLELSSMQWTFIELCVLPKAIYFHSAGVSPEGKMYIFGGIYEGEEITRSNDILSVWLHIPKLSEICWEALLHYNPEITELSNNKLINVGLPKRFAERIG